jgi:hypothetical protein
MPVKTMRVGDWGDGSYYDFNLPPEVYQWPMYILGVPGTGKVRSSPT